MRFKKVFRFTLLCLAAGAVVGLIFGLAFGSAGPGTTPAAGGNLDSHIWATTAPEQSDPYAGQPMTPQRAQLIGANEMGQVLVVAYSEISPEPEDITTRTPDQLRDDLALLGSEGFYPINVNDLVAGDIDIPAGKHPVVITFDHSAAGQYRILDDGTLDPDCAVGVMRSLVDAGYWHPKASFFCHLDVVPSDNEVFGQPERRQEKLRNLVNWGYEVGSNTMTNRDLSKASADEIQQELALSQTILNDLLEGDAYVTSLSLPYGRFPESMGLLSSGAYEDTGYKYTAAVGLDETPCPSPFSTIFSPMHIPRITSAGDNLSVVISQLKNHRELLYISDGDPTSVSCPYELAASLGEPRTNLGRPLVRY
jgi:hypothetical protein